MIIIKKKFGFHNFAEHRLKTSGLESRRSRGMKIRGSVFLNTRTTDDWSHKISIRDIKVEK